MQQVSEKASRFLSKRLFLSSAALLLCLACVLVEAAGRFQSSQEITGAGNEEHPDYAWAPALLYEIISSPNPEAVSYLYDSAFAAGVAMVPHLINALRDDRTAEFAAQSLALIGGEQALTALSKLVADRRDLNLRRFYYGALGEFDTPQANQILVNIIRNANNEPDRTVTEAAIIALTVHSDTSLLPALKQAEARLTDPVIQDDLENALSVIEARAHYLAAQPGRRSGGSIQEALQVYFAPALQSTGGKELPPGGVARGARQRAAATARRPVPESSFRIERLVFAPGNNRALAHVVFEDPVAIAQYRIVLQKQYGDWTVAGVWLGPETEKNS